MKLFVVLCLSLFCWVFAAGKMSYVLLRGCSIRDLNVRTPKSIQIQNSRKVSNEFEAKSWKQTAPLKSTAQKLSFERSHFRISYILTYT